MHSNDRLGQDDDDDCDDYDGGDDDYYYDGGGDMRQLYSLYSIFHRHGMPMTFLMNLVNIKSNCMEKATFAIAKG